MKVTSKRLVAVLAIFLFSLFTVAAEAGQFDDLASKIKASRDALATMIQNPGKRGPDQQKKVKDTADAVSAALSGMKAPAGNEAMFKNLTDTWNAFKKTRENDLVPLIVAGKQDEAVKIASGVQAERYAKMLELCEKLAY